MTLHACVPTVDRSIDSPNRPYNKPYFVHPSIDTGRSTASKRETDKQAGRERDREIKIEEERRTIGSMFSTSDVLITDVTHCGSRNITYKYVCLCDKIQLFVAEAYDNIMNMYL